MSNHRIDAKIPADFFAEPGELSVRVLNGVGRTHAFVPLVASNSVRVRVVEPARPPVAIVLETEPEIDVSECFGVAFYPVDADGVRVSSEGMSFTLSSDSLATSEPGDGGLQFWRGYCDVGEPLAGAFPAEDSYSSQVWTRATEPRTVGITARASHPVIEGTSDPIRIAGGYISGRVTREDGTAVAGAEIFAGFPDGGFGSEPRQFQWRNGSTSFVACGIGVGGGGIVGVGYGGLSEEPVATSGLEGTFTTRALPLSGWTLYFRPRGSDFLAAEWSGGALVPNDALVLQVSDDETVQGADAVLGPGGRIAGRVADVSTGIGLADTGVDVVQPGSGARIGHVHTADDGTFVTAGIPAGSYALLVRPYDEKHVLTWYDGANTLDEATPVAVAAGVETSGMEARVALGAVVTGVLRGDDTAPIQGEVTLYDVDGATPRASAYTDRFGAFRTTPGVPAGEYRVRVGTMDATYPSGWWNGAASFTSATTITLTNEEERTLDVTMPSGGVFTGRMLSSSGLAPEPVSLGYVEVYDAGTGELVGRGCTDGSGHYATNGLAKGSYKLRFVPRMGDLAPEWYPNRSSFAEAEPLAIDIGEVRVADATVEQGATLTGMITDASGSATSFAVVYAVPENGDPISFFSLGSYAYTDDDGAYEIAGLAPGSYKLLSYSLYGEYPVTWYPGTASRSSATAITLERGEQRSGVEMALGRPSFIRGHVSGLERRSYGVAEFLDPNDGSILGYGWIDGQGDYVSEVLHAGSYVVRFSAWKRASVYYGGAYSRSEAAIVTLGDGATVSGVDGSLSSGRRISGRVSAAHSGGFPAGILVYVFDRATRDPVTWGLTLEDGTFTTGVLGPGTYALMYEAGDRVFVSQWFSGASSFETAADVVLGTGVDVTGRDAELELAP